jgi:hypothetical protein
MPEKKKRGDQRFLFSSLREVNLFVRYFYFCSSLVQFDGRPLGGANFQHCAITQPCNATLQRNNHATLQRNNHATLHSTEQSRNLATLLSRNL